MVEVGSDIKGLKDLAKNSGKLKKSFAGTTLRTALRNAAKPVLRVAKAKVPVDEGDLKRSLAINAKVDRKGKASPTWASAPTRLSMAGSLNSEHRDSRPSLT